MTETCVPRWKLEPFKNEAHGRCANCPAERTFTGGIKWEETFAGPKPGRPPKAVESEAA
jgi:hypothetical protein